ncbi:MAG: hypothetical protein FJ014_06980 [Chloroflexi bacterium]|nr:hypothetical protein [Chloroflexota bacterium]
MAVEIVADPAQLLEPGEFACVVAAVPDYVPAIQRIKQAAKINGDLRVLVRDRTCATWLERFAASYNRIIVRYSVTRARGLLAARWQTEIPPHVTDEAILSSGFLAADIVPRAGQAYDDIVLEHYWGEFFTLVRFPVRRAGDLVNSLDPARWQANRGLPLVMQALERRKEQWLSQASQRELKRLVMALFDAPASLKTNLGIYKLLQGYPPHFGQDILKEWYTIFKNLGLDPSPVNLEGLDLGDTIQQIRYYLNNLSPHITSLADLEAVLDEMSGFLPEEFEWVRGQLRTKGDALQPTSQLLHRISNRFRPIQEQIQTGLAALQALIPPAYPAAPDQNGTAEDWLHWAVQEYLPYRFWLEENDRWDETMAGYASRYADWFYDNYVTNKYQNQDRWVFNLLNQARASLAQGHKVLFVLIDNFNFKYLRTLVFQFNCRGFRVIGEVEPMWAPIPTTTEVSKWCLVAGEPDLREVQGKSYKDILDKNWHGYFAGYQVVYLSKLGDLNNRSRFDADLILLNYLPIDDALHKDEQQIGTTHTATIEGHIRALVESVCRFASRARVERELVIYIASDHGSTKIPPTLEDLLDDKFYQEQAQDRHHRYITVPPVRATNPSDYDKQHCYIVHSDRFGTQAHYFIPHGYGRFIKTTESLYVHGGLTPEETIIPFCRLARTEIEARQPTIRLPENVVRYSVKASLVFVVGNPNDYEITDVELNVVESDLPGVTVEVIPAGTASEVTAPVRIKRRPGVVALENITVKGSFRLQGLRFDIQPVTVPVEVRSLTESKTGFDFEL